MPVEPDESSGLITHKKNGRMNRLTRGWKSIIIAGKRKQQLLENRDRRTRKWKNFLHLTLKISVGHWKNGTLQKDVWRKPIGWKWGGEATTVKVGDEAWGSSVGRVNWMRIKYAGCNGSSLLARSECGHGEEVWRKNTLSTVISPKPQRDDGGSETTVRGSGIHVDKKRCASVRIRRGSRESIPHVWDGRNKQCGDPPSRRGITVR